MKKIELYNIKLAADKIEHCGDYGQCYVSKDLDKVLLILGDADEPDTSDLEGACWEASAELEIAAEYGPENEEDWVLISEGIEVYEKLGTWEPAIRSFIGNEFRYTPHMLMAEEHLAFQKLLDGLSK